MDQRTRKLYLIVLTLPLFMTNSASAATITAVASGNWTTNSTWSCGCQPTNADNVIIPSGITVTTSGPAILFLGPIITITIAGTLVLNNGSLQVDATDIIKITSTGKIQATGAFGGSVFSGVIPTILSTGSSIVGPKTITNGTLPVTLEHFSASEEDGSVVLEWASASELNFDYYEISRSRDGIEFETIAHLAGAGNSLSEKRYFFRDEDAMTKCYYRLRAIDLDGAVAVARIIFLTLEGEAGFDVFPNPVTENKITAKVNFFPDAPNAFTLYDGHGIIRSYQALTDNKSEYTLTMPALEPGIYFLILQSGDQTYRRRIIVNK